MTVVDLIKKHEGYRLMPYKDTAGLITIGYGRCLSLEGISNSEAEMLFENDLSKFVKALTAYSWYNLANAPRQAVLADMAFNEGVHGLLRNTEMIGCLVLSDYAGAAQWILKSNLSPARAAEDATIMETGEWPASP